MRVCGGDYVLVGTGKRYLRLHQLNARAHPGDVAIPRLVERLLRQVQAYLGDGHLIRGGLQVQQRSAHLIVDLSPQVVQVVPTALEDGACRFLIGANSSAVENIESQRARYVKYAV